MAEQEHTPTRHHPVADFVALAPRLARFVYHLARDPRVPWKAKAAVLALGAYIISPYDLVPDWIPVIGFVDDLLFVPVVMNYVFAIVPEPVLREHWGEDLETLRRLSYRRPRRHRPRPTPNAT